MKGQPQGAAPLILVIEDEAPIRRFLRATLAQRGYRIAEAAGGEEGLARAAAQPPDLVILDLGLPDLDGLAVIRHLRDWTQIPIVVLSARERERDKVEALDLGADDYLTKPFGVDELAARIRVALRHAGAGDAPADPVFELGELRVDLGRRQVFRSGVELRLTPREYALLALLVRHAGKVLTHRQILRAVWGPGYENETHYVRVYMGQLRHKIEAEPARPRYLRTEPGVGYRLMVE